VQFVKPVRCLKILFSVCQTLCAKKGVYKVFSLKNFSAGQSVSGPQFKTALILFAQKSCACMLGSISSTFYEQLLRVQIPKAQKDTGTLTLLGVARKYVGEIDQRCDKHDLTQGELKLNMRYCRIGSYRPTQ
jgi:hypothetical protein